MVGIWCQGNIGNEVVVNAVNVVIMANEVNISGRENQDSLWVRLIFWFTNERVMLRE